MSTTPTPVTPPLSLVVMTEDAVADMLRRARREGAEDVLRLLAEREKPQPAEYLSAEQVAAMIGGDLSPKTVYAWGARGLLTAYHPTDRITRYLRSEVEAFMRSGAAR